MARPPRLPTASYNGQQQCFFTFATHERQPLLIERDLVDKLREQLLRSSQSCHVAVDAYVFMPDHVHILARGLTREADLAAFVGHFKHETGWHFRRDRDRRLWRAGFHDRLLRDDSDAAAILSYIVNNPVRAGLVTSALEYEFWGSFTHSREEVVRRVGGGFIDVCGGG